MMGAQIKVLCSVVLGYLMYLVGVENWNSLSALGMLCMLDFCIAMYVCIKKNKRIYSNRLGNKFGHFVMYTVGVITMHLLQLVSGEFKMLTDIAIGWFATIEAWSIAEHMSYLGYKIPIKVLKNITKD